ncbi:10006_t:CDS:10 [Acaulospora colombiana]|uniref:10006_t:CDS:1 n=1 Tax=Acaulospora colombiana TaxID=27376 RepID=A0ACA9KPJ8_9GLOM|nr:10006_t:CDS:10 [Acaulospora colombiana]
MFSEDRTAFENPAAFGKASSEGITDRNTFLDSEYAAATVCDTVDDESLDLLLSQEWEFQQITEKDNYAESSTAATSRKVKERGPLFDRLPEECLDLRDDTCIDAAQNERDIKSRSWVDKYRPKHYTELVGDESVNRDVLKWVNQWNYCTFGKKNFNGEVDGKNKQQLDKWDRPEKKILMLTGPPGYGKTTLAHVVARHCGYNVIEINASDDRTGQVIKNKITNALESNAINCKKKPSLIIIDEIDGVSGAGEENFIKSLIELIDVEKQPSQDTGKDVKTIQLKKTQSVKLAKKLKRICEQEELSAEMSTLFFLAELTEGDIRNCLNTLQEDIKYNFYFLGCFENFLKLNFHDSKYKLFQSIEWMNFYDQVNHLINSQQLFELNGYNPFPLISFYRFFAGSILPRIEYPRKDYESYAQKQTNEELISSLLNGVPLQCRINMDKVKFSTEIISHLMRIIHLRLETERESKLSALPLNDKLSRVVDIMLHFDLRFSQKMENGKLFFKIEPSIDSLVSFSNNSSKSNLLNHEKSKQLIMKEIDMKLENAATKKRIHSNKDSLYVFKSFDLY